MALRGGARPGTGGKRPNAGRRLGAIELAGTLRDAAKLAIEELGKAGAGKSLKDIIKRELQARPTDMLRVLIGLIPKEHDITHRDADPFADLSDEELAAMAVEARRLAAHRAKAEGESGEAEPQQLH